MGSRVLISEIWYNFAGIHANRRLKRRNARGDMKLFALTIRGAVLMWIHYPTEFELLERSAIP